MRRIARIHQKPSAALTQCVSSPPAYSARCRTTAAAAAAVATSCLATRTRAFSTTPARLALQPATEHQTVSELPPSRSKTPATKRGLPAAPVESDLVLPPTKLTIAPRPEDLPSSEYAVSHTAEGLPVVGGLKGWFTEDHNDAHWGPSKSFAGFAPSEARVTDPVQLEVCVQRAALEALAVQSAGVKRLLEDSWRADGGWERVWGLSVKVDGAGKATLKGDAGAVVEGLVGDVGAYEEMIPVEQAKKIVQKMTADWKLISLADAKLKFAVAKRVFQLTGHRISDAKLLNIQTVGGLLATVVKPEPARKVYDAVQQRGELNKLSNVSVYEKRRTPVDVAKDLGRWKVIEQELQKRGLPVLGPDTVDKFREGEWYHGPQPESKDKKKDKKGRKRR